MEEEIMVTNPLAQNCICAKNQCKEKVISISNLASPAS